MPGFLGQFEHGAMRRLRSRLLRRGTDATDIAAKRSCLVIAAHPMEETLGCAATIMRKVAAGRDVHVALVTDGRESHKSAVIPPKDFAQIRHTETVKACERMGIPRERVVFFDVQDGHVQHHAKDLSVWLEELLISISPDEVLSPSPIDEQIDNRTTAAVVRRMAEMRVIKAPVYEYPVRFWSMAAWTGAGASAWRLVASPASVAGSMRARVVRTHGFLERKREVLMCHASQVTNLTGERGWATLTPRFTANFFLTHEIFFELPRAEASRAAA